MTDKKIRAFPKRIARAIGLLSFLMLMAAGILALLNPRTLVEQIQGEFGHVVIIFLFNAVVSVVLGLLIISRNPGQMIGWLFLGIGFLFSWWEFSNILLGLFGLVGIPGPMRLFVALGGLAYGLPLMLTVGPVPLFFPDSRLPSRRWRPILVIVIIGITGQTLAQGFLDVFAEIPRLANERAIGFFARLLDITEPILILGILGSLASLVVRFIRSRGDERAQMKWLVYTATMSILIMLLMSAVLGEESLILGIYSSSIPTILTLAIGFAILRYRLYDIDLLIRRTLSYALLTALLALIYFGGVVLLQGVFGSLIGGPDSSLIIVVSTLTIAALFNPLRLRTQAFIDRRFFRQKYDAEQTLAAFAAAARDEVDPDRLTAALIGAVSETMQPGSTSVWMRK